MIKSKIPNDLRKSQEETKSKGKKIIPKRAYQRIVAKYSYGHNINIKKSTIYSRLKRNDGIEKINSSPMAEVEPKLDKILIALGHSRYPQSLSTVIHLGNEIILSTRT